MHLHDNQDIVADIINQIAKQKSKSVDRVKHLLLCKKNGAIIKQFWAILDQQIPGHGYEFLGPCLHCGTLELRADPPFSYL